MGTGLAPLISIDNFVEAEDGDCLADIADDIMENYETDWESDFDDSIQISSNRMKAHCRMYYGTNEEDKSLTECDLKWTDLFESRKQRRIVRQAISDAYTVLKNEGCKDIDWLKDGVVGDNAMVLLLAKYKGGGLGAHTDDNFDGPVIVITLRNRGRDGCTRIGEKKISFSMKGFAEVNPNASITNAEYSCYIFWSWLTEFGVHGVPKQKGNDSVVLIIRKDKLWATRC